MAGYDSKGYWRNDGEAYYDAQGYVRQEGEHFYDSKGYLRGPNEAFYDSEGYLRQPGEAYYDGGGYLRQGRNLKEEQAKAKKKAEKKAAEAAARDAAYNATYKGNPYLDASHPESAYYKGNNYGGGNPYLDASHPGSAYYTGGSSSYSSYSGSSYSGSSYSGSSYSSSSSSGSSSYSSDSVDYGYSGGTGMLGTKILSHLLLLTVLFAFNPIIFLVLTIKYKFNGYDGSATSLIWRKASRNVLLLQILMLAYFLVVGIGDIIAMFSGGGFQSDTVVTDPSMAEVVAPQ